MPLSHQKLFCALGLAMLAGCAAPNAASTGIAGPPRIARAAAHVTQGTDKVQLSFIVKNTGLPGGISTSGTIGGVRYSFQAMVADLKIVPGEVTFSGEGKFNGETARITVKGSDADPDAVTLSFDNGLSISGPVTTGYVDISDDQ